MRVLADGYASQVTAEPRTFLLPDGRLDFGKLLSEFADWWRRNGEWLAKEERIELKVRTDKSGDPLNEALEQWDKYLSRFGLDHGTLLVFDRRSGAVRNPPAPEFTKIRSPEGRDITLLTA